MTNYLVNFQCLHRQTPVSRSSPGTALVPGLTCSDGTTNLASMTNYLVNYQCPHRQTAVSRSSPGTALVPGLTCSSRCDILSLQVDLISVSCCLVSDSFFSRASRCNRTTVLLSMPPKSKAIPRSSFINTSWGRRRRRRRWLNTGPWTLNESTTMRKWYNSSLPQLERLWLVPWQTILLWETGTTITVPYLGTTITVPYLGLNGCDLFPDKPYCYEKQVQL